MLICSGTLRNRAHCLSEKEPLTSAPVCSCTCPLFNAPPTLHEANLAGHTRQHKAIMFHISISPAKSSSRLSRAFCRQTHSETPRFGHFLQRTRAEMLNSLTNNPKKQQLQAHLHTAAMYTIPIEPKHFIILLSFAG